MIRMPCGSVLLGSSCSSSSCSATSCAAPKLLLLVCAFLRQDKKLTATMTQTLGFFRNPWDACLGSRATRTKRSSSKNPTSILNSNMGARKRGGSVVYFTLSLSLQGLPAKAGEVSEGSPTPVPGCLELTLIFVNSSH